MPDPDVVDLLVIGGGTAGIVGAKTAASLGARTLLVERHRTGGDCLWTGCVPSKSLLAAASAAAGARDAGRLGVDAGEVSVDFARVRAHLETAIAHIEPEDSPETLRAAGVEVVDGSAELTGPDTARVGDRSVRFRTALVATGADPALPPVPGLAETDRSPARRCGTSSSCRAGSSCWAAGRSGRSSARPSPGSGRRSPWWTAPTAS
jgi:pyruvate/2-oxoglutarate dehydrogenase complex dihydrolipoamide dehydrogenase (E3) component